MPVTVSKLTPADQDDWLNLFQQWQHYLSGSLPKETHDRTWKLLCDDKSGLLGLIARDEGRQSVGLVHASLTPFAWAGGSILYLQDMFVTESVRGHGVGSTLLKAVYALADELGASQVFWLANQTDSALQRFYHRHAVHTPYTRFMRHEWPWFAPGTH